MLPLRVILHPTDFSARSESAFQVAYALARDHRARLIVLHVREIPVAAYGEFGQLPVEPEQPEAIRAALDKLIGERADVAIEPCVKSGDPTAEILTTAQETHSDMIVMGTHGRTGLGRLLMGSVAEQVLRKAPCPVLTVKAPMECGSQWSVVSSQ
ncbi:MAG: universal stress protein [Gemmataceae bacterium]|nr:universal stress protein [Gemmataceae bacterium]